MREVEFQIEDMLPIGMTVVVLGIALGYSISIMDDVQNDMGVDSCAGTGFPNFNATSKLCYNPTSAANTSSPPGAAYNATGDAIVGVSKLPEKLPTIMTVVVAAIILGILVTYLWGKFR